MKVRQMKSAKGNPVANQFIINNTSMVVPVNGPDGTCDRVLSGNAFQSYGSIISFCSFSGIVYLDEVYWDYSRTTGIYRNQFLGETKKETQAKINDGTYILANLNK